MIASLNGSVDYREDTMLILDVHGVGYKVFVPATLSVSIGEHIKLVTHTHVREDLLELYGFIEPQDLKVFTYLISVSGVGCNTALTVFSVGTRREIINAITSNDVSFFTSVPRLGKKNAQKIIIELKNKLGGAEDLDLGDTDASGDEAFAALTSLGFNPTEARKALKSVTGQGETVGERVRLALKQLGK